jgi:hypothetical protein
VKHAISQGHGVTGLEIKWLFLMVRGRLAWLK